MDDKEELARIYADTPKTSAENYDWSGPECKDLDRAIIAGLQRARAEGSAERAKLEAKHPSWPIGTFVMKTRGSQWRGHVVGYYSTALTPIGYCVESIMEPGSVQIYPQAALAVAQPAESGATETQAEWQAEWDRTHDEDGESRCAGAKP